MLDLPPEREPLSSSSLSKPFVITISVAAIACGTEVVVFSPDGSGGSTSTTGSQSSGSESSGSQSSGSESSGSGATGSGTATTVGVTTSVGTGPPPVECPALPPSGYEECTIQPGEVCDYILDCQSGSVEMQFECSPDGYGWTVVDQSCDYEYDSCPGTELYCNGSWWLPSGTNPPAPCPDPPPTEFATCFAGGFGGVWEHCGYMCANADVWTVATCTGDPGQEGIWEYDSACDP